MNEKNQKKIPSSFDPNRFSECLKSQSKDTQKKVPQNNYKPDDQTIKSNYVSIEDDDDNESVNSTNHYRNISPKAKSNYNKSLKTHKEDGCGERDTHNHENKTSVTKRPRHYTVDSEERGVKKIKTEHTSAHDKFDVGKTGSKHKSGKTKTPPSSSESKTVSPSHSKTTKNGTNDNQSPCRRLSILAAASLLESSNSPISVASLNGSDEETSIEHSVDSQNTDPEETREKVDETSLGTNRRPRLSSYFEEALDSIDYSLGSSEQKAQTMSSASEVLENMERSRRSSMDLEQVFESIRPTLSANGFYDSSSLSGGRMSRRNSLFSTGSVSLGGNLLDDTIFSRRLSLIVAQAASLETRKMARRSSLLTAASIFESLKNNESANNYRQSSFLGGAMTMNRRNSLLAVSSLMKNIESVNRQHNFGAANRRGSDVTVGSIFSSAPDSRRSSLDSFGNINTGRSELDGLNGIPSTVGGIGMGFVADSLLLGQNLDSHKGVNGVDMDSMKSLYLSMEKSKASQTAIHDWDRKMGLRRSHSQTMRNSSRSRKKLINVMTLGGANTK